MSAVCFSGGTVDFSILDAAKLARQLSITKRQCNFARQQLGANTAELHVVWEGSDGLCSVLTLLHGSFSEVAFVASGAGFMVALDDSPVSFYLMMLPIVPLKFFYFFGSGLFGLRFVFCFGLLS